MSLTLSQIKDWTPGYLTDTATYLNGFADHAQEVFTTTHNQIPQEWQGQGADAARQRYASDLAAVTAHAEQLRAWAQETSEDAANLADAKNEVVGQSALIQQQDFTVDDNGQVHDDPNLPDEIQRFRDPARQTFQTVLTNAVNTFGKLEQSTAAALNAHATVLFSFPDSPALAGITVQPRTHQPGYNRLQDFGPPWTDDNNDPLGHNGCDTRDDILNRDLVGKTYVHTGRCPDAVATGTLNDPYTGTVIPFNRANDTAIQIDHVIPLAYVWDEAGSTWTFEQRRDYANDPSVLLAVDGQANQDKEDMGPGEWMPPNPAFAQPYAQHWADIAREWHVPLDPADVLVMQASGAH